MSADKDDRQVREVLHESDQRLRGLDEDKDKDKVVYAGGGVAVPNGDMQLGWAELVNIAHRNYHLLPEGMEPGLESTHVMQVPTGGILPKDGRVQMYPCHSFEFHVVLMAIDHVRVYSGQPAGGPTAGIFFTRWVTHFCAPAFVFLAGAGAYLHGRRLGDTGALARYLVTRGLLLVFLELTVIRFAWTFNVDYGGFVLAGVIWMLGWCMVLLAGLVRLPTAAVGSPNGYGSSTRSMPPARPGEPT